MCSSEKDALRRRIRATRDAIAPDRAAVAAAGAAAWAIAVPEIAGARVVALYAAVRNELSTLPLARALAERCKTLAYPRVIEARGALAFFSGGPETLVPGHLQIPEPGPQAPALSVDDIDVFVIPGLAFDGTGTRLGWGKGYYDRTLAGARGLRCGFGFECQVVSKVPRGTSDIAMDRVITEAGVKIAAAGR
ncbi:MAG TPA: 5-formyltetrahydrofolate cyclo-ligase [Kofleriaceae bacterium]|nr:5-formyltetrahydrofolate cyclo-ligase [Kofleriaceae bacterium]